MYVSKVQVKNNCFAYILFYMRWDFNLYIHENQEKQPQQQCPNDVFIFWILFTVHSIGHRRIYYICGIFIHPQVGASQFSKSLKLLQIWIEYVCACVLFVSVIGANAIVLSPMWTKFIHAVYVVVAAIVATVVVQLPDKYVLPWPQRNFERLTNAGFLHAQPAISNATST